MATQPGVGHARAYLILATIDLSRLSRAKWRPKKMQQRLIYLVTTGAAMIHAAGGAILGIPASASFFGLALGSHQEQKSRRQL